MAITSVFSFDLVGDDIDFYSMFTGYNYATWVDRDPGGEIIAPHPDVDTASRTALAMRGDYAHQGFFAKIPKGSHVAASMSFYVSGTAQNYSTPLLAFTSDFVGQYLSDYDYTYPYSSVWVSHGNGRLWLFHSDWTDGWPPNTRTLANPPVSLVKNTHHSLELEVSIDGTSGSAKVILDGVERINVSFNPERIGSSRALREIDYVVVGPGSSNPDHGNNLMGLVTYTPDDETPWPLGPLSFETLQPEGPDSAGLETGPIDVSTMTLLTDQELNLDFENLAPGGDVVFAQAQCRVVHNSAEHGSYGGLTGLVAFQGGQQVGTTSTRGGLSIAGHARTVDFTDLTEAGLDSAELTIRNDPREDIPQ